MMKNTVQDVMDKARNAAGEGAEGATEQIHRAEKGARSAALSVFKLLVSGVTLLRAFGVDDALGVVGLRRKASPLGNLAIFGAGVAVGAGLGVMLAPASGKETQHALGKLAKQAMMGAEAIAKDAEEKVEESASEAFDAARSAALSAESKAERAVRAAGEKVTEVASAAATDLYQAMDRGEDTSPAKADDRPKESAGKNHGHSPKHSHSS